jgi:hypothetical protein
MLQVTSHQGMDLTVTGEQTGWATVVHAAQWLPADTMPATANGEILPALFALQLKYMQGANYCAS